MHAWFQKWTSTPSLSNCCLRQKFAQHSIFNYLLVMSTFLWPKYIYCFYLFLSFTIFFQFAVYHMKIVFLRTFIKVTLYSNFSLFLNFCCIFFILQKTSECILCWNLGMMHYLMYCTKFYLVLFLKFVWVYYVMSIGV